MNFGKSEKNSEAIDGLGLRQVRPVGACSPGDVPVRGSGRMKRTKDVWLEGAIEVWWLSLTDEDRAGRFEAVQDLGVVGEVVRRIEGGKDAGKTTDRPDRRDPQATD